MKVHKALTGANKRSMRSCPYQRWRYCIQTDKMIKLKDILLENPADYVDKDIIKLIC